MIYKEIPMREDHSSILYSYILDPAISYKKYKKRPAIIICPGGSYLFTATREGECVAARFLGLGYHVFVLRYLTYFKERISDPHEIPKVNEKSHYPEQVIDLMKAMQLVHEHSEEWYIDSDQIYTMGFSAGGHIVASEATHWDDPELFVHVPNAVPEYMKPKGILLGYPLLNGRLFEEYDIRTAPQDLQGQIPYVKKAIWGCETIRPEMYDMVDVKKAVRPDMPPVFLWHTSDDLITLASYTLEFVLALANANVPYELHIFQHGAHGMALCDETSALHAAEISEENQAWVSLANAWLRLQRKDGSDENM